MIWRLLANLVVPPYAVTYPSVEQGWGIVYDQLALMREYSVMRYSWVEPEDCACGYPSGFDTGFECDSDHTGD